MSNGHMNGAPNSSPRFDANGIVRFNSDSALNNIVNGGVRQTSSVVIHEVVNGSLSDITNGRVSNASNTAVNDATSVHAGHVAYSSVSANGRLARVADTVDRGRRFYLYFERYRFALLSGQRDDRRHMNRERVLLEQLQSVARELEGLPNSVLVSRSLALARALIAVIEQRIRVYARNHSDATRMASLLVDYLADVTHI